MYEVLNTSQDQMSKLKTKKNAFRVLDHLNCFNSRTNIDIYFIKAAVGTAPQTAPFILSSKFAFSKLHKDASFGMVVCAV